MKNDVTDLAGRNDPKEIPENSLGTQDQGTASHNLQSVPEWKTRPGTTNTATETTGTFSTAEQTFQDVVQAVTVVSVLFDLRKTDTRVIGTGDVTSTHSSALPQPLETLTQRPKCTASVLLRNIKNFSFTIVYTLYYIILKIFLSLLFIHCTI